MAGALILVAVMAGGATYVVGHAFVASRHSFLRSPGGGLVLAASVLFALLVPPTLLSFAGTDAIDPALYRALWVGLMSAGLLGGMRAWRLVGRMHGMRSFTLDESPVSRAESELLLADSLTGALDVLARENVSAKDAERLAGKISLIGSRFWFQMPEKDSEVYRLVAGYVPAAIAASVTGSLLKGAARKK